VGNVAILNHHKAHVTRRPDVELAAEVGRLPEARVQLERATQVIRKQLKLFRGKRSRTERQVPAIKCRGAGRGGAAAAIRAWVSTRLSQLSELLASDAAAVIRAIMSVDPQRTACQSKERASGIKDFSPERIVMGGRIEKVHQPVHRAVGVWRLRFCTVQQHPK
jgi:hypothetical protein